MKAVVTKARIFKWIPASAADAAVFNSDDNKILLANSASTFLILAKQVFINVPRTLARNLILET